MSQRICFSAANRIASTFINARIMREAAGEFLARLRFEFPVDALVGRLSRAERQMVEIAKALMDPKARILPSLTNRLPR